MCGFVVILERDPRRAVDPDLLERATACLAHRGPDDRRHEREGNVGLGFCRLAIQDLSPNGAQPLRLADDPLAGTLVFNGEFYGFQAERRRLERSGRTFAGHSDTEVVLALLQAHGRAALERLRGMFACAWWRPGEGAGAGPGGRLLLARDRLGQKPLYLWRGPERLIVASELKAILADPSFPRTIDPAALASYLALGTIPEPQAIFQGVEKLEPGTWLELDGGGTELGRGRYFSPADVLEAERAQASPRASLATSAGELRRRLEAAVRSHLVADVEVGAYLSGGLDSAGIAAVAAGVRREAGQPPLTTFSVGFSGSALDESPQAQATAAYLGTDHHQVAVTADLCRDLPAIAAHLDEPFGVASAAASYYLAQAARRRVTVALSGDGADELFGGYPWRHARSAPTQLLARLPRRARRLLHALAPAEAGASIGGVDSGGAQGLLATGQKWLGAMGRDDAELHADLVRVLRREEVAELLHPELGPADASAATRRLEQAYRAPRAADSLDRALLAELETTLCCEMLAKVDRTSMAWGLEVRVPYLDEDVVSLALALPAAHKVGWRSGKKVLREALKPLLPPSALSGPKRGFTVPVGEWLRGQGGPPGFQGWAREQLRQLGQRGLVRAEACQSLLERHLAGGPDRGQQVYLLLALEAWAQVSL